LPTTQAAYHILQVVNIQFGQYLLHFRFIIPRTKLIYFADAFSNFFAIIFLNSGLIFTHHRHYWVIAAEDIFKHRFAFVKVRVLLKQCYRYIFIYKQFALVGRFLPRQNAQ
jgi:hypothetical protein